MGALGRQIAAARGAGPVLGNSVALAEACDTACDASGLAPESRFAGWLSGLGATGGVADVIELRDSASTIVTRIAPMLGVEPMDEKSPVITEAMYVPMQGEGAE